MSQRIKFSVLEYDFFKCRAIKKVSEQPVSKTEAAKIARNHARGWTNPGEAVRSWDMVNSEGAEITCVCAEESDFGCIIVHA